MPENPNDSEHPNKGFGQRVKRAASIEFVAFGLSQVIRLGVNVALARLLFPGAFGLVASINAVNIGIIMLSDVGLGQSIVQNDQGDDPDFLNTAWTMSIMRGVLLWIVACLLSYPVSLLQGMPELQWMLPVGSLPVLISGFRSTSFYILQRRLNMRPLALIELSAQVIAAVVMIAWATVWPSPWALVAGAVVSSIVDALASYLLREGPPHRLCFHREHAKSIFNFGKWIVGSSTLSFMSGEGHKLLLGRPLGATGLGVYHMADQLASAVGHAMGRLTGRVIYPALCEVQRDRPDVLRDTYYRTRKVLDLVGQTLLGALIAGGPLIVDLLYGKEYRDAGWILQILCLRSSLSTIPHTAQYCLMAQGHSRYNFYLNVGRLVWLFAGVPTGFALYGFAGVVWAVATVEVPAVVVVYLAMRKHGLLRLTRELIAPLTLLASIAVFSGLRILLEPTVRAVAEAVYGLVH